MSEDFELENIKLFHISQKTVTIRLHTLRFRDITRRSLLLTKIIGRIRSFSGLTRKNLAMQTFGSLRQNNETKKFRKLYNTHFVSDIIN